MESTNASDRAQFVIRLTREEDAGATIGYAIVEQTAFVSEDGGAQPGGGVMLDEFRRLFERHADKALPALPISGTGQHGGVELASFAGASVDTGASVNV